MSQHDYVIRNDTGAAVRADINDVLSAIASNNSGATEPATTYAYQFWADTTTGILKIRNSANSAWIAIGTLSANGLALLPLAGGTLTGALLAAVGTVSLPGIAFSGDANTGIYWVSADVWALVCNGAEVFRVQADPEFKGTGAVLMPVGTTAQRPSGTNGYLRYNSDLSAFEGYAGGNWKSVGGGGGGAGFRLKEIGGNSPVSSELYSESVYLFESGLAQELYASIKVPQTYSSGTQIFLYLSVFSASSSNTILMQSQSTLIAKNSTAFNSTTNQRTSTNSALTNTVANMLREVVLDITSNTGTIDSVAVAAGDVIKIKIYRGTDTDTADINLIANACDVKFG